MPSQRVRQTSIRSSQVPLHWLALRGLERALLRWIVRCRSRELAALIGAFSLSWPFFCPSWRDLSLVLLSLQ
ncbi:hypothetical protein BDV11DRAFT_195354 [Aspergillus similis]